MRTRTLWLLSIMVTATVIAIAALVAEPREAARPEAARPETGSSAATSPATHALAVLRAWDRRRATAWAKDDASTLQSLYVRGSAAGRHDLAMLAAYESRGLRVRSMRRQVLAVHLRRSRPRLLSLTVTDRLVDGMVEGAGRRTALPDSRPAMREIQLRRVGRRWRVVEVYAR